MRLPSLKRVFISSGIDAFNLSRQFIQFVEYLREALEPLLNQPRAQSSVQTVTLTAATAKTIDHLLTVPTDKTPNGWQITDINAAATVYRAAWTDKTITLVSSATCTVQLECW